MRQEIVGSKSRHRFQGVLREGEKWGGRQKKMWGQESLFLFFFIVLIEEIPA